MLVRLCGPTAQPELLWHSCMSSASQTTTNNTAEYWTIIHGLYHTKQQGIRHLHVVGDSQLILNQMEERRRPKAGHLQRLYFKARRCVTEQQIADLHHHRRRFNKMADAAANTSEQFAPPAQASQRSLVGLLVRMGGTRFALHVQASQRPLAVISAVDLITNRMKFHAALRIRPRQQAFVLQTANHIAELARVFPPAVSNARASIAG